MPSTSAEREGTKSDYLNEGASGGGTTTTRRQGTKITKKAMKPEITNCLLCVLCAGAAGTIEG
jgi:hypothetical protein